VSAEGMTTGNDRSETQCTKEVDNYVASSGTFSFCLMLWFQDLINSFSFLARCDQAKRGGAGKGWDGCQQRLQGSGGLEEKGSERQEAGGRYELDIVSPDLMSSETTDLLTACLLSLTLKERNEKEGEKKANPKGAPQQGAINQIE